MKNDVLFDFNFIVLVNSASVSCRSDVKMVSDPSSAENHDDIKEWVRRKCDGDIGYATLFTKLFSEEKHVYEVCFKHTTDAFMNSTKHQVRENYDGTVDELRE